MLPVRIAVVASVASASLVGDIAGIDRSPEAELKSFRLADPNLRIELVASEPDVESPVAIAWTPDGSLFVAEMPGYPTTENTGRIKKLSDPDGDGRYTLVSVFADDLNFPNHIMPYRGGILVTDAPSIYFLEDTDGDGVADRRETIFSGFKPGNEQLRVNGLYWGLDNWIYGANGRSGGSVTGARQTEPVAIDGRDFRFRPDLSAFEAITGLSQFGLGHDDWGNRFTTWNHRFARQVMLEQRHLERNPTLNAYALSDTSQSEHDRRVHTLVLDTKRFNRDPVGYFTSLSGLTANRGPGLGPDYRRSFFAGASAQAAVVHRKMDYSGVALKAINPDSEREFIASTDGWFHPVNFSNGPDGGFYLVDFYRSLVEHPQWAHEDKREGVDWELGREYGRIWRIYNPDIRLIDSTNLL